MIEFLINKIKLEKRILSGYLVTSILTVLIALISYLSFNNLASDFRKLIVFKQIQSDNIQLSANLSEMQRQALRYIYEGDDSIADGVSDIYEQMLLQLGDKKELYDGEMSSRVSNIYNHLQIYHETFVKARKQRDIQQQQLQMMDENNLEDLFERLLEKPDDDNMALKLGYNRLILVLQKIRIDAYRYFNSLDGKYIKSASINIKIARNNIKNLSLIDSADADLMKVANEKFSAYENSLFKAVQFTRGYLYLVNVVMAAQAYETLYQGKSLSKLVIDESRLIQDKVSNDLENAINLLFISVLLLLLFIIVYSYIISQSITVPLNRLTETFRGLISGNVDAKVPAYNLDDALGKLTNAASIFKQKDIELRKSKRDLERSNEELEQFVFTVSHDLKSPVVTSMGFISIINKLAEQGKYQQAFEKLHKVEKSNERMSELINDLLVMSRVGKTDIERVELDLDKLLSDFLNTQESRFKQLQFSVEVDNQLPIVYANGSKILQVVENILSNALKYASAEDAPKMNIGAVKENGVDLIYFKDNGPGIPKQYHEKIFSLFYRLDDTSEGTGIGLAIARKIMKLHGGDIWVESQSGEGTTFWIKFQNNFDAENNIMEQVNE